MTAEAALAALVDSVPTADTAAMAAAGRRQAALLKPAGALGRLEQVAVQIAGVVGTDRPGWRRKAILVFAADHGVAAAGVSAYPPAVTGQMLAAFAGGSAAINVLAREVDARLVVVDVGVAATLPPTLPITHRRLRPGTAPFTAGPALTRTEATAALLTGAELVEAELARGVDLLAVGEMGIGNTTAAAAVAAALLGADPATTVGRGTGVDDAGLARKLAAVRRGLAVNRPDPADPLGVLAAVGGLELAAIAGALLRAAAGRRPVVLDGYVAGAAALAAARLAPDLPPFLIAAHRSPEPGHRPVLAALGLRPLLELDLRLGEASGAALGLAIVAAALATHDGMATFAEAGVAAQRREDEAAPAPVGPPVGA